ncbi:MAG TPA: GcrA family cell cycle regulator [Candidatus Acidoferrum sp.]
MWTEERETQLRELACSGINARKIAQALGATRNAIIGKAYRLGRLLAKQKSGPAPDPQLVAQRRAARLAYLQNYNAMRRAIRPAPVEAPPSKSLPLLDLAGGMCHWPVSDDIPHCFCGNETAGHVYCPFHHTLGIDKHQGRRAPRVYVF